MKRWVFPLVVLILLLSALPGCQYTQSDLDEAYQQGYNAGLASIPQDIDIAYANGYGEGYDRGYDEGNSFGYDMGYQNGFWDGEDEASGAYAGIAEDNYDQGYLEGYEDCLNGYTDYYEELQ